MNSVTEAQVELHHQIDLEFERCKSPLYFYRSYWTTKLVKPRLEYEEFKMKALMDQFFGISEECKK